MNDFLTLDDINGAIVNHTGFWWYEIDFSKITTGEDDFSNVQYDFCKISREKEGEDNFKITIQVQNNLWTGGAYADDIIGIQPTSNPLTLNLSHDAKVWLYMSSCQLSSRLGVMAGMILNPLFHLNLKQLSNPQTIQLMNSTRVWDVTFSLQEGYNHVTHSDMDYGFVLVNIIKTDLQFNCNSTLTIGKINTVPLEVNNDYKPSGALVDGDELDAVIIYNNQELPVYYDSTLDDYCFQLDLTNEAYSNSIPLTLKVYETEYINNMEHDFRLSCEYEQISSFTGLENSLNEEINILELSDTITCTNNLILNHDCLIKGKGNTFDLDSYSIIVDEGVSVQFEDIDFVNGSPCIIQRAGSECNIVDCSFTGCSITDTYKGSVVSTLTDENIITNITESSILNCPHSIWHTGELTLTNLTATYNNYNHIDTDYSLLLTMPTGILTITESQFLINITAPTNTDLKYSQSLFSISENTQLNNTLGEKLKTNNALTNLFDTIYNNTCNTHASYYYPQIESNVTLEPIIENKNTCYHILDTDKIYKHNIKITRTED